MKTARARLLRDSPFLIPRLVPRRSAGSSVQSRVNTPPLPCIDPNAYEELGWEYWQSINELHLVGLLLLHP